MKLSERPTPDLIVICMTFLVGFVIVGTLLGMIAWKLLDPDANISVAAVRIAGLTNTLIGAIVGYLAGRGVVPGAAASKRSTESETA